MMINEPLNGVTVCVDFDDILEHTLPYNRLHYERFVVVTATHDERTQALCRRFHVDCLITDVFYERGTAFNKWAGLELGLDHLGRSGWINVLDCDILIPRNPWITNVEVGKLYTPLRRNFTTWQREQIPNEPYWRRFAFVNRREEHAGYFHLFHADSLQCQQKPWYSTEFSWAGTADTLFQQRWHEKDKLRPKFEVLHIGETFTNWAGRVQPRLDGKPVPQSGDNKGKFAAFMNARRINRFDDRYKGERL